MTWLVAGGAGYIGAHVVRCMTADGNDVVVLDDLSTGRAEFVPAGVSLVEASILDTPAVERALDEHAVTGVIHLAALKYAGLSVQDPLSFYRVNVDGTRSLLQAMVAAGTDRLVFSSSCSVYGNPDVAQVTEETSTAPVSPYGETKLISEWLIDDVAQCSNLTYTNLRYFNVVGSGADGVHDLNPYGLLPAVMKCLTDGVNPSVNGTDYPTRDGTCERDYIHVSDLARAHVRAAHLLDNGSPIDSVYNLGTGQGATVLEILELIRRESGMSFETDQLPRRHGDPARIVASAVKAHRDLGWAPQHDYSDMIRSAWQAWLEVARTRTGASS